MNFRWVRILILFIIICLTIFSPVKITGKGVEKDPEAASAGIKQHEPSGEIPLISPSSIIGVTYDASREIEAVKYDLEAAEYAFDQFERGLSQFTPFIMNSYAERDTSKYPDDHDPDERTDYEYGSRVGMKKEFFNGSSISGGVGYSGEDGHSSEGGNSYVEMEYRFPLFGSYTSLRRITARTFEENEVLNARLDYVDTVRDTIQRAQELYFWLLVMMERLDLSRKTVVYYNKLLEESVFDSYPEFRNQLEDEITSIQSDVTKYLGDVDSYRVLLQDRIGFYSLPLKSVERIDLYDADLYGLSYLERPPEIVIEEARENDAEMRVLELARENSKLKRELAKQGKWDIFGEISGSNEFDGYEDDDNYSGYNISFDLDIRRIDPHYLEISLNRARAEINKYSSKIERRKVELANLITRKLSQAKSLKNQAEDIRASITSRKKVLLQKQKDFLGGEENLDNLISIRRDLYDSQRDLTSVMGQFYEIITELDEATGVYFEKLGITIQQNN